MTLLQRRILMVFFIFLFFLTAPLIILFAQGYRFDWKHGIFVYSGSITVKSYPRNIDIYLDGKKQDYSKINKVNRSYTINGIKPGKYNLRCQKDGFTTWEKTVQVKSGIATEFWNVILFPIKNKETAVYATPLIDQFFISPRDKNEIIFFSKKDNWRIVYLLDIEENVAEEIYRTDKFDFLPPTAQENIEWSTENERILIPLTDGNQKIYILAKVKKENLKDIIVLNDLLKNQTAEETDNQIHQVRWMFDKNNELVILTKNKNLYYFDTENPEEILLIDKDVSGFDFAGNRIYYTQLPNNIVWEIKDNNIGTKRQITTMPININKNEFVKLTVYDQYRIAIETKAKELFVYNKEKEKGEISMQKLRENIEGIQFSNDGKKILYWTSNELWVAILRDWKSQPLRNKGDEFFITRFSAPLKNAQWMDDFEHVIFSVNDKVKVVEIDTRNQINIVDVAQAGYNLPDRMMFYNKDSQTLFHFVQRGDITRLRSSLLIDRGGFLGL